VRLEIDPAEGDGEHERGRARAPEPALATCPRRANEQVDRQPEEHHEAQDVPARKSPGGQIRARAVHRPLCAELEQARPRHQQWQRERPAAAPLPEKRDAERDERNEPVVFAQAGDAVHGRIEERMAREAHETLREEVQIGKVLARGDAGQTEKADERDDRHAQQPPRPARPGVLTRHVESMTRGIT